MDSVLVVLTEEINVIDAGTPISAAIQDPGVLTIYAEPSERAILTTESSQVLISNVPDMEIVTQGVAGPGAEYTTWTTTMSAGVAVYTLPQLPNGVPLAYINGIYTTSVVTGTTLTITEYPAYVIEADDILTVLIP